MDKVNGLTDGPQRIYLQPRCCITESEGRLWCEHDAPENCEDGVDWTAYVRADLAALVRHPFSSGLAAEVIASREKIEALEAENAALRAELAAREPVLSADERAAINQALHEMLGLAQDNVPEWREKYIAWATTLSNLLERAKR
jgi:hypothetical protein